MKTKIQGTRTRHVITFNPNKANPGEVIYIDTPKLKPDVCLVPGSLNLMFDFKNANDKSWFQNNLSKFLTKELTLTSFLEFAVWRSGFQQHWRVRYGDIQGFVEDIHRERQSYRVWNW